MNQTKFQALVNWVRENGGYVDKDVYVDGQLLRCKKDKLPLEVLIRIPYPLAIKGESWIYHTIELLNEIGKGKESFYYPYIDMLPSMFEMKEHPFFKFKEDDIQHIEKINLEASLLLKNLYKDYNQLKEKGCSQDEEMLKYAIIITSCRARERDGFTPVLDMLIPSLYTDNCKTPTFLFGYEYISQSDRVKSNDILKIPEINPMSLSKSYIITNNIDLECNTIPIPVKTKSESLTLYFCSSGIVSSSLEKAKKIVLENEKVSENELNIKAIELLLHVINISIQNETKPENSKFNIFWELIVQTNNILKKSRLILLENLKILGKEFVNK